MFRSSNLFSEKPSTRLSRHPRLAKLQPIFDEITKKMHGLKTEADAKGPSSFEHKKYIAINQMMTGLTVKIDRFNNALISSSSDEEVLSFVKEVRDIVMSTLMNHGGVLSVERNCNRIVADQAVNLGCYALVFVGTSMLPFASVVTLISMYYVGPEVSSHARSFLAVSQAYPYSYMLIHRLNSVLCEIGSEIDPAAFERVGRTDPSHSENDPQGYFDILCMRPDTPAELFTSILNKHYHYLASVYHPDKCAGKNAAQFMKLKEAHEFLSDENNRRRYCSHHKKPGSH